MPYIKMDALSELEICIPSTIEAERISFFLNAIEILITLHQRKLDKLKAFKQACLNEMFV